MALSNSSYRPATGVITVAVTTVSGVASQRNIQNLWHTPHTFRWVSCQIIPQTHIHSALPTFTELSRITSMLRAGRVSVPMAANKRGALQSSSKTYIHHRHLDGFLPDPLYVMH